jgi:hypothetical protein
MLERVSKDNDFLGFFLGEPASHFGLMFEDGRVMHWSFRGFITETEFEFLENRTVVFEIDYDVSKYKEDVLFEKLKYKYRGSTYDYAYFFWITYRAILRTVTIGYWKIPYREPFGDTTNNMICHEALEALPEDIRPEYDRDKSNTPYRLYLELEKGLKDVIS